MRIADLAGKRVAIWGYGREGRAAVDVLSRRLPQQPLTLFCSEAEASSVGARFIALEPLRAWESGRDESRSYGGSFDLITSPPDAEALKQFDVVIKSPGISPYKAPIPEAQAAGVRFTSGTALWFAERPDARVIAVTGTKGKSTVSALIAHLLRQHGLRIALAGNIGMPLLDLLDVGRPEQEVEPDWWVIELSSFQTRDCGGAPAVALINNIYQEHLDWHGDQVNYQVDKAKILERCATAVLNASGSVTGSIRRTQRTLWFNSPDGWHVRDGAIWRGDERMLPLASIPLPGLHNAHNVCAAFAAIEAAGFFEESGQGWPVFDLRDQGRTQKYIELAQHVTTFKPLPHRLQRLGARDGIDYINDSISTTPYAAIEALRSLSEHEATILVGGFDRGLDWQPFVDYVAAHPPHAIVTMGANGPRIAEALCVIESAGFELIGAPNLAQAFDVARAITCEGGTILLSPGAPSFDQFRDYAERGREFARLAGFDPATISEIEGLGIM